MKTVRKQRAISPVIATIILVAVTLVVAVAVGSYVFGLFGASSRTGQVSVTSTSLTTTGLLTVTLNNKGGIGVAANSATVTIGSATFQAPAAGSSGTPIASATCSTGSVSVPASTNDIKAYFWTWCTSLPTFAAGQTYTISLAFSDGSSQTIVVVAQ